MGVEPNFRELHGPLVSALVRSFGSAHLDDILDAVQDAFLSAVQSWPHHGQPESPLAWLRTVATRRLIDRLRVGRRNEPLDELIEPAPEEGSEIDLFFMACSPDLSVREQVCLMLRTLGGLTAAEIAHLLLESEEAVQRRISRSKTRLQTENLSPDGREEKLPSVLLVLYLIFTEGHDPSRGATATRPHLALAALRLAQDLRRQVADRTGQLDALLAIFWFHMSRLGARVDPETGRALLFDELDPGRIDPLAIQQGFRHLKESRRGAMISRYHLEAGLASAISISGDAAEIRHWHELIATHYPSPMARLSLAIARGEEQGPEIGLKELEPLRSDPELADSPHLRAAMGYFYAQLGQNDVAASWYRKAAMLTLSASSRQTLELRAEALSR